MSTRNFVPRADGEGSIGTEEKNWGAVHAKELYAASIHNESEERQPGKTYNVGDVTTAAELFSGKYLQCVEGGTAGSGPLVIPDSSVGSLVQDGEVLWKILSYTYGPNVLTRSTQYSVGTIVFCPALAGGMFLECTTAGTTATTEPTAAISAAVDGTMVSDGTVIWTAHKLGYARREPFLSISETSVRLSVVNASDAITVTYKGDGTLTAVSSDTSIVTARVSGNTVTVTRVAHGTADVTISLSETAQYFGDSATLSVLDGVRYGYRIKKSEGSPSARVEYLFDAVGMTPAHMDFTRDIFDFGDWGDKWFVTDNKPCMMKSDGTVDYYLNPNNYAQKEDGTASDVANTAYDGNAMSLLPQVWVHRYEDSDWQYEIISDVQYDSNYKAYAHTRADGTIADWFAWSIYGGSGTASKIRSLSGQALAQSLTAEQEIAGSKANGSNWYTHSWSQRELIRTLLILMGKSTDTQSVFGYGNCRSAQNASGMLTTGTLDTMGQFFGYSDSTHQVKVFHIEKFWGDQFDRTAGVINSGGKIYVKMTPEGSGYRISDTTGYTNTGVTLAGTSGGYISAASCSENGIIPVTISGSGTTFYCDGAWFDNSQLDYLLAGADASLASDRGGAFAFGVNFAPSHAPWQIGCGLSCEQPAAA